MKTTTRSLFVAGLLSLCVVGLNAQAQTASPGPGSRNANVDQEDPNKPKTPENAIPNQEAPGAGNTADGGAAGTDTPTGGDGSDTTKNSSATQHTQGNTSTQDDKQHDEKDKTSAPK